MRSVDALARGARAIALMLGLGGLTACQDLAAHQDFIDPTIGDAVAANKAMQTIDPWPRRSFGREIPADGDRAAKAIENYRKGEGAAGGANTAAPSTR
jgi:type IV pilus biogenesis protein CpaD/CtpE